MMSANTPPISDNTAVGIADRILAVQDSRSTDITDKARQQKRQGADVIVLSAGDPDFPTPEHILQAAHAAALAGQTKYPPLGGTPQLKDAIRRKLLRDCGIDYSPQEIAVANGSKQIIFNTIMSVCSRGDEVIVPTPCWISYMDMVRFSGASVITVACKPEQGFQLDPADIARSITARTKLLILNFPNNPTGAVMSGDAMRELAAVLLEHPQVLTICDDVYEHFLFDGGMQQSLLQTCPHLRNHVISANSVSKTYRMTGWRVGFCTGPRSVIDAVRTVQGQSTSGVNTIAQAAAAAALDGPQDAVHTYLEVLRERRDTVVARLNQIPAVSCTTPQGAFYVLPNISRCLGRRLPDGRLISTDFDFADILLEQRLVAVVPGTSYGAPGHVRLSLTSPQDELDAALDRIASLSSEMVNWSS